MNLPLLRQLVLLDKGQAAPVALAIYHVLTEIVGRDPHKGQQMLPLEALALAPLNKLLARLDRLAGLDNVSQPRRRPHRLTLNYDQLMSLRLFYGRLLDTTTDGQAHAVLRTALGQFHQPSLNLESHIRLPPPTGPGSQTSLL